MNTKLFTGLLAALATAVWAEPRTSADYSLAPESTGGGGGRASSANYTSDADLGGPVGLSTTPPPNVVLSKAGYVGQLYEVTALTPSADPTTVDEGGTRQLEARATCDDGTALELEDTDVVWSVFSGPLAGIDTSGLATAALVYANTPATARLAWGGLTGDLILTVLDTVPDNYGSYADDGLGDDWQVGYFGLDNPLAGPTMDPDGDTQDNRFEEIAGLDPTDPLSRLWLRILADPDESTYRHLAFRPVVAGRSYRILSSTTLGTGSWAPLPGSPPTSDNGDERTITDLNATEPKKFYRVEVTRP
jgi:hypothetical protein